MAVQVEATRATRAEGIVAAAVAALQVAVVVLAAAWVLARGSVPRVVVKAARGTLVVRAALRAVLRAVLRAAAERAWVVCAAAERAWVVWAAAKEEGGYWTEAASAARAVVMVAVREAREAERERE
jgi:hypothetical protein